MNPPSHLLSNVIPSVDDQLRWTVAASTKLDESCWTGFELLIYENETTFANDPNSTPLHRSQLTKSSRNGRDLIRELFK